MYGEKEEEVTELRMDLMDVKQMYKQQVWYITYREHTQPREVWSQLDGSFEFLPLQMTSTK